MSASIGVTTSLTPNLIMHLMACAGIAGRKDYGRKFKFTINAEEMAFMKSFDKDFVAKPPLAGGPLFTILFQVPSYFPANSFEEISEVFKSLRRSLEETSLNPFKKSFPCEASPLDKWIPPVLQSVFFTRFQPRYEELMNVIDQFIRILRACYERFYKDCWLVARKAMQKKALKIQKRVESLDLLEAWREVIGKAFPYPSFAVYLCEPGNTVSSTMAEKIVIPNQHSVNQAIQAIVHEVGVHFITLSDWIQNPKTSRILMKDREGLIRVQEAAICHLKSKVLKRMHVELGEDRFLLGMRLEREVAMFSSVWKSGRPLEIIDAVAEAYRKLSPAY